MSNRVTWGEQAYAGFWLRLAGRLIDWLLVGTVATVLAVVLAVLLGVSLAAVAGEPTPGQEGAVVLAIWLALVLPDFLYDTIMTSKLGWTVGKRAVGIEVRRADGELISFGQAAGRWFGRIVSSIPLYLGFLWAAWDSRKQTWHDKFVKCFVVRSSQVAPAGAPGAPQAARPWGGYSGWGIPSAARPEPGADGGQGEWGGAAAPGQAGAGQWGAAPGLESPPGSGAPTAPDPWTAAAEPEAREPAGEEPAREEEPAARTGAPEATDWARELDWSPAEPGSPPRPAVEGESLESARWAGAAPAEVPGAAPGDVAPGEEAPPVPGEEPAEQVARAYDPSGVPAGAEGSDAGAGEAEAGAPVPDAEPEPPPAPRPDDPNVVGISRAGIPTESAEWLEQVADQVDARLDRVTPRWRSSPQAEAARACAFGLLLGHLATIYPHMGEDLSRVAEAHPSFSTLPTGNRLATLQRIVAEPRRAAAWLGPLIGAEDPSDVQRLLD